jgi:cyclophilin family peptidyl-prolyl cis-trans isomerase
MSRFVHKIRNLFPGRNSQRPHQLNRKLRARLELQPLEDRCLLASLTGLIYVDGNGNGIRDAQEAVLPGVTVTLTGTTQQGNAVNASATTDAQGSFNFQNVLAGTYQLSAGTPSGFFSSKSGVASGLALSLTQTLNQNLGVGGLAPAAITLRQLLSSTKSTDFPFSAAGTGVTSVGPRQNHPPTVMTLIADVSVAKNSANTTIDLAGNFTDPDFTNSQIRFDTTAGPINVTLFDAQAPRTVANFFNYILSHRYDNTIFHRLAVGFVLQGGGFTFQTSPSRLTPVLADPAVQNEFGTSNTQGTLAMAKLGGDPNSATDQFFFNLANNSSNLDNQNGGFTVFGRINGSADQTVLNALAGTPVKDESKGDPASAFSSIPLNNYTGTNFPTDTASSNYIFVNDVAVVSRNESLTYAVVSNTNTNLVTTTITNNRLTLRYSPGQTGTATITVQAIDQFGATVSTSFKVTVS